MHSHEKQLVAHRNIRTPVFNGLRKGTYILYIPSGGNLATRTCFRRCSALENKNNMKLEQIRPGFEKKKKKVQKLQGRCIANANFVAGLPWRRIFVAAAAANNQNRHANNNLPRAHGAEDDTNPLL